MKNSADLDERIRAWQTNNADVMAFLQQPDGWQDNANVQAYLTLVRLRDGRDGR